MKCPYCYQSGEHRTAEDCRRALDAEVRRDERADVRKARQSAPPTPPSDEWWLRKDKRKPQ